MLSLCLCAPLEHWQLRLCWSYGLARDWAERRRKRREGIKSCGFGQDEQDGLNQVECTHHISLVHILLLLLLSCLISACSAARMGDDVTLQSLLSEHPSLATAADYNGRTPLVSGLRRA